MNKKRVRLSIVVPCYDEEDSLGTCIEKVLEIEDEETALEIIIVDDGSSDNSLSVARDISERHPNINVVSHERNKGKGAALRTGFQLATGDFVAVQDADLEYDPADLKRLLEPLRSGKADVVFGSRFLSYGAHRVLYFWHALGNKFLTFLSNIFTDLNLTDMETCYKVFRRDVIQSISLRENRFGFEPEIIAKIAQRRLRIYEMGISYYGRTYSEGKKIGPKDGLRALYCILRYNAHKAPLPVQFLLYFLIGSVSAVFNLMLFLVLFHGGLDITMATPAAFLAAAGLNYVLCVLLLFRHTAQWNSVTEVMIYLMLIAVIGWVDLSVTRWLVSAGTAPVLAKGIASLLMFVLNFLGRRFFVFSEPASGPWQT